MKLPAFFSHREGLPVADNLPVPSFIHQPLKRMGVLCLCLFVLSVFAGILALLLLEGMLLPERFATNIVPGIGLALLFAAGALAGVWLRRKGGWWKPASQLVFSVTGLQLGPEGILLRVAALLRFGRSFSDAEKDVLSTGFITAGIAAWFGTPLAAVALVFFSITKRRTGYLLFAAFIGGALHYAWYGFRPLGSLQMPGIEATGLYVLLGLLMGVLGALTVRIVQVMNRVSGSYLTYAAIVFIAVMIVLKPSSFGPGIAAGRQVLMMQDVTLAMLMNIAIYRLLNVTVALGARFPGSILTPLVAVGAASGILNALWLQSVFSSVPLDPQLAAITGVAALMGSITRLPLMALLFVMEISWQPAAFVPALFATIAAYAVSAVFLRKL